MPEQSPGELQRFVRDFTSYADIPQEDLSRSAGHFEPLERPVHPVIPRSLLAEREAVEKRSELRRRLERREVPVELKSSELAAVLGYGWSTHEPWGVWTDGEEATLRLPLPAGREWMIRLEGRPFPEHEPVRIGHAFDGSDLAYTTLQTGQPVEASIEPTSEGDTLFRLHLPDAASPHDIGISSDKRHLGFGLTILKIQAT